MYERDKASVEIGNREQIILDGTRIYDILYIVINKNYTQNWKYVYIGKRI